MSVNQFEEAKEMNQKWKYSTERTSKSWPKVEATALGSSWEKIDWRAEKGTVMIVQVLSGWLASSYPTRQTILQHIS